MIHERKLFARLGEVSDGDEFVGCNLSQTEPGDKIFEGKKGLKFTRCNLARAVVPAGSIVKGGNTSQTPIPPRKEPEEMEMVSKSELTGLRVDRTRLKQLEAVSRG